MDGAVDFYINDELQTKIYILKGTIEIDFLIEKLRIALNQKKFNQTYNILVDIQEAELPDFIGRMYEFIDFCVAVSKNINMNRRCAILTAKPSDVVVAELLRMRFGKINFELKIGVYSTLEAANDWLT